MDKKELAAAKFAFIREHLEAGRVVHLATALRITALKKKHLAQIRVNGNSLEVQHGNRWLDHTYSQVAAI
jgi:hypothetical protein